MPCAGAGTCSSTPSIAGGAAVSCAGTSSLITQASTGTPSSRSQRLRRRAAKKPTQKRRRITSGCGTSSLRRSEPIPSTRPAPRLRSASRRGPRPPTVSKLSPSCMRSRTGSRRSPRRSSTGSQSTTESRPASRPPPTSRCTPSSTMSTPRVRERPSRRKRPRSTPTVCSGLRSVLSGVTGSCSTESTQGASAPSSNTYRLLARDHAAPQPTLALAKASSLGRGRVRPLAWCSRPRSSAALLDGALALDGKGRAHDGDHILVPGRRVADPVVAHVGRVARNDLVDAEGAGPHASELAAEPLDKDLGSVARVLRRRLEHVELGLGQLGRVVLERLGGDADAPLDQPGNPCRHRLDGVDLARAHLELLRGAVIGSGARLRDPLDDLLARDDRARDGSLRHSPALEQRPHRCTVPTQPPDRGRGRRRFGRDVERPSDEVRGDRNLR